MSPHLVELLVVLRDVLRDGTLSSFDVALDERIGDKGSVAGGFAYERLDQVVDALPPCTLGQFI